MSFLWILQIFIIKINTIKHKRKVPFEIDSNWNYHITVFQINQVTMFFQLILIHSFETVNFHLTISSTSYGIYF